MSLTPFIDYKRDWKTHIGYDVYNLGRIHSHTIIIPSTCFSISNLSDFPIVITLTAHIDNGQTEFVILDEETIPVSGLYVRPDSLFLLAGDYLTVKATDQGQPVEECKFNTMVNFKELLET